jgi:hypothetical protein
MGVPTMDITPATIIKMTILAKYQIRNPTAAVIRIRKNSLFFW